MIMKMIGTLPSWKPISTLELFHVDPASQPQRHPCTDDSWLVSGETQQAPRIMNGARSTRT